MRTFWLYSGARVLTAVRLPDDATDREARMAAMASEERCSIGHHPGLETPAEFRSRLHTADVRTFDNEEEADAPIDLQGQQIEEARKALFDAADLAEHMRHFYSGLKMSPEDIDKVITRIKAAAKGLCI